MSVMVHRRAIAQLAQDGYDGTTHRAAQFYYHADADMFLAMDHGHVNGLIDNGVDPEKIYLFRPSIPPATPAISVTTMHLKSKTLITVPTPALLPQPMKSTMRCPASPTSCASAWNLKTRR